MDNPGTIFNWGRLDDRITTSGEPTEAQLTDICSLGVRHVVNLGLHTHEKSVPDEAASVSRFGMKYSHIPVDVQNPTVEDFDKFCAVIEHSRRSSRCVPIVANFRVSAFICSGAGTCLAWTG